jgi:peptidoglycan/xylan/chitin deacetylase (PgdA/CDA1 family)/glycosyltransferase involved in cell wall biosynthesis
MALPEISVLIPTYNRRDTLAITLPTVLRQDFPPELWEVIVVIDGSTDATAQLLRQAEFAGVRIVEQQNKGLAAARNAGLQAARGRTVLFLDDDMECEPTLVRCHALEHQSDARVIVEGAIELSPNGDTGFIARSHHDEIERHFEKLRAGRDERWPWHAIRFANSSAPRNLLIEAGGFDERFRFAHEDLELGLRLAKTGVSYRYVSGLTVRHVYRKTADSVASDDARRYGSSYLLLGHTHPEYRKYSPLTALGRDSSLKGRARALLTRWPIPLDSLLRLSFAASARMESIPGMRGAALRLLEYRRQIGVFRGARDAAGSWEALRREFALRLPVLMYHHVGPRRAGIAPEFSVTPAEFAKQMGWLARWGYTPIRPRDWMQWCLEGKPIAPKPILITFDDAYADFVDYAFPELRRRQFTATVFVVSGLIGKTNQWDEKDEARALKLMNAAQIREWNAQGIEFGSHSRTHRALTELAPAELEREIVASADELAAILGSRPDAFAYPYGKFNAEVAEQVARAYALSFTVQDGLNSLSTERHLQMRRVAAYANDTMAGFRFALQFGFRPTDRLRERVSIRTRLRAVRQRMPGLGARSSASASSH